MPNTVPVMTDTNEPMHTVLTMYIRKEARWATIYVKRQGELLYTYVKRQGGLLYM